MHDSYFNERWSLRHNAEYNRWTEFRSGVINGVEDRMFADTWGKFGSNKLIILYQAYQIHGEMFSDNAD